MLRGSAIKLLLQCVPTSRSNWNSQLQSACHASRSLSKVLPIARSSVVPLAQCAGLYPRHQAVTGRGREVRFGRPILTLLRTRQQLSPSLFLSSFISLAHFSPGISIRKSPESLTRSRRLLLWPSRAVDLILASSPLGSKHWREARRLPTITHYRASSTPLPSSFSLQPRGQHAPPFRFSS